MAASTIGRAAARLGEARPPAFGAAPSGKR